MSLRVIVSIEGIKQLEKLFDNKENRVYRNQKEAVESGCAMVVADAKAIVPVLSGYLRANIVYEILRKMDFIIGKVGVRDIVDYAEDVEFMIERGAQPAKPEKKAPFLHPSLAKNQKEINKMIADATVKGLS